jgi:hypothetical protein
LCAAALLLAAGAALGQEEPRLTRYVPESRTFACELPGPDWQAFEVEEPSGVSVHLMAPGDPNSPYRTGIDVRLFERGQSGFVSIKEAIDRMRRGRATAVKTLRLPGSLVRLFEVTESRWLPQDSLPARQEELHHYVAVIPSGESYYVLRLSSPVGVYLDYRLSFLAFLKSFRPLGARD